jgi:hypothetical protein
MEHRALVSSMNKRVFTARESPAGNGPTKTRHTITCFGKNQTNYPLLLKFRANKFAHLSKTPESKSYVANLTHGGSLAKREKVQRRNRLKVLFN